ncbi:MAG: hypothetical protein CMC74_12835 [Flavobacteriaceae bacterium]|nr:hypothetical protein [Flavobacteriaceae bacterium]|tara:strand:- start:51404 stop:52336 length:933 start_codon:yes stop_codon:yes gene_type:complete
MKWEKKGQLFDPRENTSDWIHNYAALPVCDLISEDLLRIYFSTRDAKGRSLPTFIEVSPKNPKNILKIHSKPILSLGAQGTFDDNGIMPSSIVDHDGKKYLYYIGWNPQVTVSYRLSIGLAISEDGIHFEKFSKGPILDRDKHEPFFNTAPYVIKEGNLWKMWYVSCTGWKNVKDWPEPWYLIRYAESHNGIDWERKNVECIGYDDFTHAIGKPMVFKENEVYHMIYSYRNSEDYRTDASKSYRLGYATSKDGLQWERKDSEINLKEPAETWESIMQEYSSTFEFQGQRYLVYNGNGFGATGFGYAQLIK